MEPATDHPGATVHALPVLLPHLPPDGAVFADVRGADRAMKVSFHTDRDLVVLSIWHGDTCAGTLQLAVEEVPELIAMLGGGLEQAYRRACEQLQGPVADTVATTR